MAEVPLGYFGAIVLASLGLSPPIITEWLATNISAQAISWITSDKGRWTFVAVAALVFANTQRRHHNRIQKQLEDAQKQRGDALSLPAMSIKKIAEHVRDRSAWGWRKRRELNLKEQLIRTQISAEMRRAGMNGQVRFIGSPAISLESTEIDPTYWTSGAFEGNDIWDEGNVIFASTSNTATENVPYFRYGRAPRDDVINCWPEASIRSKIFTKSVLCVRKARRGFSAVWQDD